MSTKERNPGPIPPPSDAEFGAYIRDLLASVQKPAEARGMTMLVRLLESAALEAARIADDFSDEAGN